MNFEETVFSFEQALLSIDKVAAGEIFEKLCKVFSPVQLVEKLIPPALERIGFGWEQGMVALSQVYMSARICEELVNTILPQDVFNLKKQSNIAIVVLEDYHLLGKRIVSSMLRASGFELLDYGHGAKVDDLVNRVRKEGIKILLISTLMLRSALLVRQVRKKLNDSGCNVRIVVGGAPFLFDSQLWKDVGADAMGHNAAEAIAIVAGLRDNS